MILSILNVEVFILITLCLFTLYGVFLEKIVGSRRNPIGKNTVGLLAFVLFCSVFLWTDKFNGHIFCWNNQIISDNLYLIFGLFIILVGIFVVLMPQEVKYPYEFYLLFLSYLLACLFIMNANDFVVFYLGVELQAFCVYILIALNTKSALSIESAYKYFIMGALGSFFLLLGAVVLYGLTGTLNYSDWFLFFYDNFLTTISTSFLNLTTIGVLLLAFGFLLKLALAPLHFWIADVYEGCSWNIIFLVAIVNKVTLFVSLLRLLNIFSVISLFGTCLFVFGAFSLIFGLFGAVQQVNLKRFFAYTGVVNLGYIIGSLSFFSYMALYSSIFYIFVYLVNFTIFICLLLCIQDRIRGKHVNEVFELSFLYKTQPYMSLAFGLLLFSFGGVPPLVGFFGKFFLLLAFIEENALVVLSVVVIASVISVFYYIRIVKKIYFIPQREFAFYSNNNNYLLLYIILIGFFFNVFFFVKPYAYFIFIDDLVIKFWLIN